MRSTTALMLLLPACAAFADTFGTGENRFIMDFVPVSGGAHSDPVPEPTNSIRYGAVPYDFRMGKHEVSRAMVNAYNALGGVPAITLANMSSYGGNGDDKPATGITWNEAARFVNWLNTSTGHSPAYKFTGSGANDNLALWSEGDNGYDPANRFRNSNARYFLPGENEWYRAAYYDPVAKTYRDFPTGTDTPNTPVAVTGGTAPNTAVFDQTVTTGPANVTQAGGLSPFGTMAQGGNVFEWMESAMLAPNDSPAEDRASRGGVWYASSFFLMPGRQGLQPTQEAFSVGFRVASIVPAVKVTNIALSGSNVTLGIESNFAKVDVYRSLDLNHWGAPVATGIAPGNGVLVDSAAPAGKAFYQVAPHGFPAPD